MEASDPLKLIANKRLSVKGVIGRRRRCDTLAVDILAATNPTPLATASCKHFNPKAKSNPKQAYSKILLQSSSSFAHFPENTA